MKAVRPPGLLVLAVLLIHLLAGHTVQRIHEGWLTDGSSLPPRMKVALVQAMPLSAVPARAVPAREAPNAPGAPALSPRRPQTAAAQSPAPVASGPEPSPPEPSPPVTHPVPLTAPTPAPSLDPAAAAAQPLAAAASDGDATPGPEWPLSTRLSYEMTGNYRGPVQGQAQVEWLRKGRNYQVHLDVSVGPSFAPFITRSLSSQGQLTPEGITPERFDEATQFLLGERRHASLFFLSDSVQLATGVRQPSMRGGQDAASQFAQLTWLFKTGREPLQAGRIIELPLVLLWRQYRWQYELVGEEVLDTPMGPLATWHLRPSVATQRAVTGGDLTAEVWLAPRLEYLPVRLRLAQSSEVYFDLMLKSAPLQAAPESEAQPNQPAQPPQPVR